MDNQVVMSQGSSLSLAVKITYNDGTDYPYTQTDTVRFGLLHSRRDEQPTLTRTAVYDDVSGAYMVSLAPEDTAQLPPDRYFYDIGLQTAAGDYFMLVPLSEFVILPAASRKEG